MTRNDTPAKTLLTHWARLLLESFAAAGVREAIISPGSRSTPFVAAALEVASLRCTVIIDERAAAFYALGQAKATGMPSLLICTSGTAGANYLPAVIEAENSYTPMLVLTADRPPELAHCHAPQTIDQIKLFGGHARGFFELGTPDPAPTALRGLRRVAAQAVLLSRTPTPGTVHLNARVRKPLEPTPVETDDDARIGDAVRQLVESPQVLAEAPALLPGADSLSALVDSCRASVKGLIVCGPAPLSQAEDRELIFELARRTGYPLLTEATSQLRFATSDVPRVGALDSLGRSAAVQERLRPELILQLGAPPIATGWSQALEAWQGCRRIVLAPHGWNDPWSSASALVMADLRETLRLALPHLEVSSDDRTVGARNVQRRAWMEAWTGAESIARTVARELTEDTDDLSEGAIPKAVLAHLPEGSLLALGNSLPIRQVDGYCPPQNGSLRVLCQRGASGIDGLLAGAAGAARALDCVGALILGDVSFLHGIGGLACFRDLSHPFTIVVVNNNGGRIFEQLALAQQERFQGKAMDPWTTPHGLDFASAAKLFGLPYHRAHSLPSLRQALAASFDTDSSLPGAQVLGAQAPGASVIEAVVPPHGAVEQNHRLWREIDQRIAKECPAP